MNLCHGQSLISEKKKKKKKHVKTPNIISLEFLDVMADPSITYQTKCDFLTRKRLHQNYAMNRESTPPTFPSIYFFFFGGGGP